MKFIELRYTHVYVQKKNAPSKTNWSQVVTNTAHSKPIDLSKSCILQRALRGPGA